MTVISIIYLSTDKMEVSSQDNGNTNDNLNSIAQNIYDLWKSYESKDKELESTFMK